MSMTTGATLAHRYRLAQDAPAAPAPARPTSSAGRTPCQLPLGVWDDASDVERDRHAIGNRRIADALARQAGVNESQRDRTYGAPTYATDAVTGRRIVARHGARLSSAPAAPFRMAPALAPWPTSNLTPWPINWHGSDRVRRADLSHYRTPSPTSSTWRPPAWRALTSGTRVVGRTERETWHAWIAEHTPDLLAPATRPLGLSTNAPNWVPRQSGRSHKADVGEGTDAGPRRAPSTSVPFRSVVEHFGTILADALADGWQADALALAPLWDALADAVWWRDIVGLMGHDTTPTIAQLADPHDALSGTLATVVGRPGVWTIRNGRAELASRAKVRDALALRGIIGQADGSIGDRTTREGSAAHRAEYRARQAEHVGHALAALDIRTAALVVGAWRKGAPQTWRQSTDVEYALAGELVAQGFAEFGRAHRRGALPTWLRHALDALADVDAPPLALAPWPTVADVPPHALSAPQDAPDVAPAPTLANA